MASKIYGQMILRAFNGEIDWDSNTVKVALLNSSYTPNQDTHVTLDQVQSAEVTGTGYTAGGATLTGKTATYDGASNVTILDADDVTWSNSTITARYAVLYADKGGAASGNPLLGYVDFGVDQASTNGNFTITWDSGGIFRITVA
jgi:hypothetical protein